jgi:hypothetical protein
MTKDEFREFVTQAIMDQNKDFTMGPYVDKIVAQWEQDIEDARITGQDEATNAIENYNASDSCMGPCCGGSI